MLILDSYGGGGVLSRRVAVMGGVLLFLDMVRFLVQCFEGRGVVGCGRMRGRENANRLLGKEVICEVYRLYCLDWFA